MNRNSLYSGINHTQAEKKKVAGCLISTDDADRLHEIALALKAFRNMLGADEETDGLCLLIDPFVNDLVEIDDRIPNAGGSE